MRDAYARLIGFFEVLGPGWSVALAIGLTVLGAGVAIAAVVFIPADHFVPEARRQRLLEHPFRRGLRIALRNLLGLLLIPIGFVLSLPLVPGPGLVFIVLGLSLVQFPGRRKIERRILGIPSVRRFFDSMRQKFGRQPLEIPEDDGEG